MRHRAWVLRAALTFVLIPAHASTQLLPPAQDGDIRVVYWELINQTEVWLTLTPNTPRGDPVPASMTFAIRFCGKRPAEPVTGVEVRALAGLLFVWKQQLGLVLDGRETIPLAGPDVSYSTIYGSACDGCVQGVLATISIDTLKRIASAASISGDLLGTEFVLAPSQRAALARFLERVLSDNPGLLPEDPFQRLRPCPPKAMARQASTIPACASSPPSSTLFRSGS
jgi:hypothetical protein